MKSPQVLRLPRRYFNRGWHRQESVRAFAALALGLLAISFAPIFIRLSEIEITPYATIFHRSWMAALIFGGLRLLARPTTGTAASTDRDSSSTDRPPDQQQALWDTTRGLTFLLGTTFTVAVVSWAWALTQTTVANSTLLHSFTPLFTGLFAWLLWGQRFNRSFWGGMAIAVGGAILLGIEDFSLNQDRLWGDGASLFSAVFFSAEPLLVERLRRRIGPNAIMFWCFSIVTLLTLPIVLLAPSRSMPVSLNGWLAIIAMAMICQALGHGLLTYCLKSVNAGAVSLSHLSVPLFSALEAWFFFGEPLTPTSAIAFAIILGGIAIGIARSAAVPATEEQPSKATASVQPPLQS